MGQESQDDSTVQGLTRLQSRGHLGCWRKQEDLLEKYGASQLIQVVGRIRRLADV